MDRRAHLREKFSHLPYLRRDLDPEAQKSPEQIEAEMATSWGGEGLSARPRIRVHHFERGYAQFNFGNEYLGFQVVHPGLLNALRTSQYRARCPFLVWPPPYSCLPTFA